MLPPCACLTGTPPCCLSRFVKDMMCRTGSWCQCCRCCCLFSRSPVFVPSLRAVPLPLPVVPGRSHLPGCCCIYLKSYTPPRARSRAVPVHSLHCPVRIVFALAFVTRYNFRYKLSPYISHTLVSWAALFLAPLCHHRVFVVSVLTLLSVSAWKFYLFISDMTWPAL